MYVMRDMHIGSVNLNLVPALAALLEERHVSRAAARLRLSQPAMSRALQQLRRHFNDELLVRGPDGYTLTPRAERIREQLATTVVHLERLFTSETFDPAAAAQSFRVAASDYTISALGPALVQTISTQSPRSTLICEPMDKHVLEKLDAGTIDLLVYGDSPPNGYRAEALFDDRFVCVVSAGHPLTLREPVTASEYLKWPHVNTKLGASFDNQLAARGITRRIGVTMPNQVLAARILPGTDLVLTAPARLLPYLGDIPSTQIITAPAELGDLHYYMVWHRRLDIDPSQQWLRNAVKAAAVPSTTN